jgi:hypothetical protein
MFFAAPAARAQADAPDRAAGEPEVTEASDAQSGDDAEPGFAHGTRQGAGDSRGPGRGDGTGAVKKPTETEPPEPEVVAPEEEASPLAFSVGDGDLRFAPSLQYRLRYLHNDGRDFSPGDEVNVVRHRARLGMAASYREALTTFLQFQDVRTFGEEQDPSGDFTADGIDLHQGYLQLGPKDGFLRLGRQQLDLNNERLVGVNQFTERTRSFDGARAVAEREGARIDVAWALVRDYSTNPEPITYGGRHIAAADLRYEMSRLFVPDMLVLFEGDTNTDLRRVTAGGNITGSFGGQVFFDYIAEAWVQYGKENEPQPVTYWANLSSFQFRANVDVASKPFVYLEATFVSGDDDPTDDVIGTFTQPYPRAHRVLGQMDYFINFRRDTDERGVRDLSSRVGWKPFGLAMDATVHIFDAMARRSDGLNHYGWELDFRLQRRFLDDHLGFDAVYAFFVPGELIAPAVPDPDIEHFGYVILDSIF